MASLLPEGKQSFTTNAGVPLVGGKLYTYDAGTSTPRATYSDAGATTPNTNPVILDARGEATIFWSGAYKVVLKDASDVTIWTVDNVSGFSGQDLSASTGAGLIGFSSLLTYAAGTVGKWLTDLTTSAGAGVIGFLGSVNYSLNTVGWALRRELWATDYGCKFDGVTDDTAALQAAFNAASASGKRLNMPPGTAIISSQVTMALGFPLRGSGERSTILKWTGNNASTPMIATGNAATTDAVLMEEFGVDNAGTAKCAIEIKTVRATLRRIFNNAGKAWSSSVIQTDTTNTCFHIVMEDCALYCADLASSTPYGVIAARGHTFVLRGCMFSGFSTAGVRAGGYAGGSVGTQAVGVAVFGCRFEAGTTAGVPGSSTSIGLDVYEVEGVAISGCNFELPGDGLVGGAGQRAIKLRTVRGGSITGNYFNGGGQALGAIDVSDAATVGVTIEGNYGYNMNAVPIVVKSGTGDLTKVRVGYNHIGGGTTKSADLSWTPTISFGGASVGVTYDAANTLAEFRREGKWLVLAGRIKLTNKGSSTGVARVGGLPATAVANNLDAIGVAAVSTYTANKLHSYVQNGSAQIRLINEAGSEITDANFTNTSEVLFSISIQVEA